MTKRRQDLPHFLPILKCLIISNSQSLSLPPTQKKKKISHKILTFLLYSFGDTPSQFTMVVISTVQSRTHSTTNGQHHTRYQLRNYILQFIFSFCELFPPTLNISYLIKKSFQNCEFLSVKVKCKGEGSRKLSHKVARSHSFTGEKPKRVNSSICLTLHTIIWPHLSFRLDSALHCMLYCALNFSSSSVLCVYILVIGDYSVYSYTCSIRKFELFLFLYFLGTILFINMSL